MKLDLHVHTSIASPCSLLGVDELLDQAERRGLDGVCVTDHERYEGFHTTRRASQGRKVAIFMGVEVRTTGGDLLAYTPTELDLAPLERVTPQALIDYVASVGGVVVAAHPFRTAAPSIGRFLDALRGLGGVEVLNGNSTKEQNRLAAEAAASLGLPGTGGSDAHWVGQVGVYWTEFPEPLMSQGDFVAALRAGLGRPGGTGTPPGGG